jgi:hypothetical protein
MTRRIYTYSSDSGWANYNLIESVGGFVLAVGLVLIALNLVWSRFRGAPAGADPFFGGTLEWVTSSPPPHYNFAVIPHVSSPYPNWDRADRLEDERSLARGARVFDEGHGTVATTVKDGYLDDVLEMPSESGWPIVIAACLTALFALVLASHYLAATAFAGLAALALYTHPWGGFLVFGAALAWLALVVAGPQRRELARDGALGFGAAALLFAPWLPTLLYQAAHTGAPWSHRPTGRSLVYALRRIWSGRRAELVLFPAAAVGLVVGTLRTGVRGRRELLALAIIAAATLASAYAYSRFRTPAWALRYLVVALAPLALLVASGLGRLTLIGPVAVLAAALLVWHGRPTTATLERKSNVTYVAHRLSPSLRPGTLVFSTQPEQVPALAHELPAGMRFLTPLGPVRDPGVMDWRDAMTRLRAARYAPVLGTRVRALEPGTRVLLVQPLFSHPDARGRGRSGRSPTAGAARCGGRGCCAGCGWCGPSTEARARPCRRR